MDLSDLIESVDIVEYISQFVNLTKTGEEWWGLSCFKNEKTPSFSVRRYPPVFYDYSSGIGGNLYTFVKRYYQCSGKRAVEIIKEYAGFDGEVTANHEKMRATLDCIRFMPNPVRKKRCTATVLDENCMEKYEKREDKLRVWESEGISRASLDKFQVYYDAFSDRLVYPIRNLNGRIINIGGRTLDSRWKEKGLRKYTYFYKWGTIDTIYGMHENMEAIKNAREVILFEGCKSVLIADTWGIHNTGAILTSHLNFNQMELLAKTGVRAIFALDKDVCPALDKNINKLKKYINVEYIWDRNNLLDAKDSPVDKGKEVFETLYEERRVLK